MIPADAKDWPYVAITHTAEGWTWDVMFQDDRMDRGGVTLSLYAAFAEVAAVIEASKN